jgi:hypothetical protein
MSQSENYAALLQMQKDCFEKYASKLEEDANHHRRLEVEKAKSQEIAEALSFKREKEDARSKRKEEKNAKHKRKLEEEETNNRHKNDERRHLLAIKSLDKDTKDLTAIAAQMINNKAGFLNDKA